MARRSWLLALMLGLWGCLLPFDLSKAKDSDAGTACFAPACCAGCWDGVACLPGDQDIACGSGGARCVACQSSDRCRQSSCGPRSEVVDVSTAELHTCAVIADGRAYCWGSDMFGELGDGPALSTGPELVAGPRDYRWILAAGGFEGHSCGGTADHTARCWGRNVDHQLGDGTTQPRDTPWTLPLRYRAIAGGSSFGCGIGEEGSLSCWGYTPFASGGRTIEAPTVLDPNTDWTALAAGSRFMCGLRGEALYCWGYNDAGQLGVGDLDLRTSPSPVSSSWTAIAGGEDHACGIRAGSVWCMGRGSEGQLGAQANASAPVQVALTGAATAVCAAKAHSCAILDGRLFCWGSNAAGQLGRGAPLSAAPLGPAQVGEATDWARVVCAGEHSCALKRGGSLWCWGSDSHHQIAVGQTAVPLELRLPAL